MVLKNTHYKDNNLTEIIIPADVDVIPDFAFYHCTNVKRLIFNGNSAKIGKYAFSECFSLQEILWNDDF